MALTATDDHVLRARRTAAGARALAGLTAMGVIIFHPHLLAHPRLGFAGFVVITASALVQHRAPGLNWIKFEESFAGVAAILIIGVSNQRVTVLSMLWLTCIASGVLARGGRVHWVGRTVVLGALMLPILETGHLSADHAGLCVAAIGLLLVCGRLTRELNHLLTQARYDADHDDLTGLLSRAAFRACLDELSRNSNPDGVRSLLLFDLNNFGEINKTRGHAAGDALLASVAERINRAASTSKTIARLGGDEFALITESDDPTALAHEIVAELELGIESCGISACVGIAQSPRDGRDAEALLRAGDVALRVAKRSGLGSQISSYVGESLSGDGGRNAQYALARLVEGNGITTVVQPIVDLRDGGIHAYEALARFDGGATRSPLHWFSLAEEFHQREELERACLKAALELFDERPAGVRLSVNLSGPVLLDPLTLSMLEQPSDLNGLIIEITEQALVQNDERLQAATVQLQQRGACLAIDDMGAGYSGLRQITAVNPTYLKLDRSLVSDIHEDPQRAALISALVGYADHVGSLLVAEGIESQDELTALIQLGVPLAQGFYLAYPGAPWPQMRVHDPAMENAVEQPLERSTAPDRSAPLQAA
ncbi:MAG TPA: EAL domain-containing protein [Solirubrobacteraceae bacterium]